MRGGGGRAVVAAEVRSPGEIVSSPKVAERVARARQARLPPAAGGKMPAEVGPPGLVMTGEVEQADEWQQQQGHEMVERRTTLYV